MSDRIAYNGSPMKNYSLGENTLSLTLDFIFFLILENTFRNVYICQTPRTSGTWQATFSFFF